MGYAYLRVCRRLNTLWRALALVLTTMARWLTETTVSLRAPPAYGASSGHVRKSKSEGNV